MRVTLKDIANEVGVTPSLVSRVLNGKAAKNRIKKDTEKLIKKKAEELNYKPNEMARGLRLKESKIIGLITPDIENPFFSALTKKIQSDLSECGYSLIIFDSNEDTEKEKKEIEMLKARGVDGLIIIPVGRESEHIKKINDENLPLVLLYRIFEDFQLNTVTVDNYSAITEVIDDLVKRGHTKIGMIQGGKSISSCRERIKGYKDVLRKHSIAYNEEYIVGDDFSYMSGYLGTKKLLIMKDGPTAIILTSEMITLGSFQAITESDKKIPDDINVISFDSLNFSKSLIAPIDSVIVPKDLLASNAVKMILENIKNKMDKKKTRIVLSCNFTRSVNN